MISLLEYINEWKEDTTAQVVIIMGTPGCGKTYWMQHSADNFFKKQGIKLNAKQLDIDHTLKKYQLEAFPDFCCRLLNYKTSVVTNKKTGVSIHNNDKAWKTFIDNEQDRFIKLNRDFGGNESNVPSLKDIDYEFCAPFISRYDNATDTNKQKVEDEFVAAMKKEYFNKIFASDFSVRGEAKEEYNNNLIQKIVDNTGDVYIAISGAKMKTINEICSLAKDKTIRLVYLNGNVEKAVVQDAKRERSGGEKFVRDYAQKIDVVWDNLMDKSSKDYFKNKNIYKVYEFTDTLENDTDAYPNWKLDKTY